MNAMPEVQPRAQGPFSAGPPSEDARLLAGRQLPVGWTDLLEGQRTARRAAGSLEHIKPRLLGHWGTTPGLNFLYVHHQSAHQRK